MKTFFCHGCNIMLCDEEVYYTVTINAHNILYSEDKIRIKSARIERVSFCPKCYESQRIVGRFDTNYEKLRKEWEKKHKGI